MNCIWMPRQAPTVGERRGALPAKGAVRLAIRLLALAVCGALAACAPDQSASDEPDDPTPDQQAVYKQLDGWTENLTTLVEGSEPVINVELDELEKLSAGEPVELIIVVNDSEVVEEYALATGTRDRSRDTPAQRNAFVGKQQSLVTDTLASINGYEDRVTRFGNLPLASIHLKSLDELETLASQKLSTRVESIQTLELSLAQSLPLVDQTVGFAGGLTGAGTSVAVLDTGVDYLHSSFGCTAPGVPATCKVIEARDFAPNDNKRDDNGHGTNCAGIVLGVAPDTKIIALDVFKGAGASSLDIINAINWVIDNRDVHNIKAMSMSLGGGRYTSPCPNDSMAAAIATARQQGILSAVATGNDGYKNAIASPACAPAAVSVGAVYDANVGGISWSRCTDQQTAPDKVTCFSNSTSFITMLAPGAMITAAGHTMGGTSQATPHVAGAIAALRSHYVEETPDQIVTRMLADGVAVKDTGNNVTKPRLRLRAPEEQPTVNECVVTAGPAEVRIPSQGGKAVYQVEATSDCEWSAAAEGVVPWLTFLTGAEGSGTGNVEINVQPNTGSERSAIILVGDSELVLWQDAHVADPTIVINGDDEFTKNPTVQVTLALGGKGLFSHYCLSDNPIHTAETCGGWASISSQAGPAVNVPYTLDTQGENEVFAWFRKTGGAETDSPATDSIVLDSFPPFGGSIEAELDGSGIGFGFPGWQDEVTGIATYRLSYGSDGYPKTCNDGENIYEGTEPEFFYDDPPAGEQLYFSLCVVDAAGNASTLAQVKVTPTPDGAPPAGGAHIDAPAIVNYQQVYILNEPADPTVVKEMCLSNTPNCVQWQKFKSPAPWKLSSANGEQTVYLWYRDIYGTISEPIAMSVTYDKSKPTKGILSAVPDDGRVELSWSGVTDQYSAIEKYWILYAVGTKPNNCASGTLVYEGPATAFAHTGLTNGVKHHYRLCAVDEAGNESGGTLTSATPNPQ